jgi:hypothetical protein
MMPRRWTKNDTEYGHQINDLGQIYYVSSYLREHINVTHYIRNDFNTGYVSYKIQRHWNPSDIIIVLVESAPCDGDVYNWPRAYSTVPGLIKLIYLQATHSYGRYATSPQLLRDISAILNN